MLDAEDLLGRAIGLVDLGVTERRRCLLGIVGAPATGKSTLAAWLVARLQQTRPGEVARMDAFHLANAVLDRRGLTEVKGAPQTFDAQGYLALLRRLRDAPDETSSRRCSIARSRSRSRTRSRCPRWSGWW